MSPSLGSYDPEVEHSALAGEPGADDEYFEKFGYGENFGDGRLGAGYVEAARPAPSPAAPPPAGPDPLAWPQPGMEADGRPVDGGQATGWNDLGPEHGGDGVSGNGWSGQQPPGTRWTDQVADDDWSSAGPAGPSTGFDHPANRGVGRDLDRDGGIGQTGFDGIDDDGSYRSGDARRNLVEWGVVLVGAVLLALVLRALVLQAFWIPSPSMETTLLVHDRVLVNKISYRLHDVNRGDVVVFRRTDTEIAENPDLPHDVIKRVIALGGETIEIRGNQVFIDGQLLQEPYLDVGVTTSDFGPELVPEGHVFVMGDNRQLSLDSRFETGPVAEDRVVGRAFFLFWPLNRVGAL